MFGDAFDRRHVGPGNVGDVDEVARLVAVLEHPGRFSTGKRRPEEGCDAGIWRVRGHPRSIDIVIAQSDRAGADSSVHHEPA